MKAFGVVYRAQCNITVLTLVYGDWPCRLDCVLESCGEDGDFVLFIVIKLRLAC
jgi:hypothetical protein